MRGQRIERLLRAFAVRYVPLCERRPLALLVGVVVLTAVALAGASRIHVDPRLASLLDPDDPGRRAVEALSRRAVSSAPLYLLVASGDPHANRRIARRLAEGARRWPETVRAHHRRDPSYFLDRRLLYLPASELDALADDLRAWSDYRACEAMPGCVFLDDTPPEPDVDRLSARLRELPEVDALRGVFGPEAIDRFAEVEPDAAGARSAATASGGALGELCSPDGRVCAVEVLLRGSPDDLEHAERILERAEALFAEARRDGVPPDLRLATSGAYRVAPMTKALVERDLARVSGLSLTLVLGLLLLQFRGARALVLLLVPLAVAAAWTAGLVGVLHPDLNVISAFTLVVMIGLGVDFGIHLLTHYGALRARALAPGPALREVLPRVGPSMCAAAATTACGFAALLAARFRGFAEIGWIGPIAVLTALLAFVSLFPLLVVALDRWMPERCRPVRSWSWLERLPRVPRGVRMVAVLTGAAAAVLAAFVGGDLQLEHDFRKLRPRTVSHGIHWNETMHGTTRTAVYLLAESPERLEEAADELRRRDLAPLMQRRPGAPVYPAIITPASFVPPDQAARLAAVARLRAAADSAVQHADADARRRVARLRPLLDVDAPITPEALPAWASDWFRERDGRFGTLGVLYTEQSGADARQMAILSSHLEEWRRELPGVELASPVALLGEVIPGLERDAPRMVGLAVAGLFAGTLLLGGSLRRTALVLLPVAVTAAATAGILVWAGVKLDLYNVVVLPLAFGVAVDGAIYMTWSAGGPRGEVAWTARAIAGSTLTTAASFGSMCVASNPGLVSLGTVAIVAMGASLVANLGWLPALLGLRSRGRPA